MRRGFAASAAEEWMAVCRAGARTRTRWSAWRASPRHAACRVRPAISPLLRCHAIPTTRPPRACSRRPRRLLAVRQARHACDGGEQSMSQSRRRYFKFPQRPSMNTSERKREAAHGLDRVTTFSGRKRHMSSPLLPISGPFEPITADRSQQSPAPRTIGCVRRPSSAPSASRARRRREPAAARRRRARADRRRRQDRRAAARGRPSAALLDAGDGGASRSSFTIATATRADAVGCRGARAGRRKAAGVGAVDVTHRLSASLHRLNRRPDHDLGACLGPGNDRSSPR